VILLVLVGLIYEDTLIRLTALKQCVSLVVNIAAAVFFLFSGQVLWQVALVMTAGALAGGAIGGLVAGCIAPSMLKWTVVVIGIAMGIWFLVTL
jgi:uncharacterized membrane protein YfcA